MNLPDTSAIDARLHQLHREWDLERAIELESPLMILAGVAMGTWVDRRLVGVSAFAAGSLLLHALQGWYPLIPALRRAGVRTAREIADEAYAFKQRRGDFAELIDLATPEERAAAAYRAASLDY